MSDDVRNTQRWCSFYNASGETIPAYGVINLVSDKGASSDTVNFCRRLVGKKFSSSDDNGLYALNSRFPVPAGQYGECTFARSAPAFAAISQTDLGETPDISADEDWIGQDWGPVQDKWTIGSGSGFVLMARPEVDYVDGLSRVLVLSATGKDEGWLVTYSSMQFAGDNGEYTPGQAETPTTEEDLQIKLCGNRDIENASNDVIDDIKFLVAGSRVKKWHSGAEDSPSDEYDYPSQVDPNYDELIDGKWFDSLIGPGELVFCKKRVWEGPDGLRLHWMPVRGGSTYFPFAQTKEDIIDEGQVYVYVPKDPLNNLASETYGYEYDVWPPEAYGYYRVEVLALGPITREVIPAGTYVSLEWQPSARKLVIRDIGCPFFE